MPAFSFSSARQTAVALLLVIASAASCKRDGSQATGANPASIAAVKAQFDVLRDSAAVKWGNVDGNDQRLLGTTRLLLGELKGQPGVDAAQLQQLERANARLKARRYTRLSMANPALIDQYDAAQDSLLHAVYPVAAPNGTAPSDNIRKFVEGIQQLDTEVVRGRMQYDRAAQQHNAYLQLHQPELQGLGGKYASLKPLPLFTIGAQ